MLGYDFVLFDDFKSVGSLQGPPRGPSTLGSFPLYLMTVLLVLIVEAAEIGSFKFFSDRTHYRNTSLEILILVFFRDFRRFYLLSSDLGPQVKILDFSLGACFKHF